MSILVIAEHDNATLKAETLKTVAAAQKIGTDITLLVAGFNCQNAVDAAVKVNVTREVDAGLQTVALNLPAIVTTDLRLNEPRYASLPNIMKAKRKPLAVKAAADFGIDLTARTKLLKVTPPAERQAGIVVETVDELVEKLKNEAKVIS